MIWFCGDCWIQTWGYDREPDLGDAPEEHDAFAQLLRDLGLEVYDLEGEGRVLRFCLCVGSCGHHDEGSHRIEIVQTRAVRKDELMAEGRKSLGIPVLCE